MNLPTIYKIRANGRVQKWEIKIGYIDKTTKNPNKLTYGIDGYMENKHYIVLESTYGLVDGKLQNSYKVIKRGKANRTTLEQGILQMNSMYSKKVNRELYSTEPNELQQFSPMLAKRYIPDTTALNFSENYFVQPKLDGERAIAKLCNNDEHNVEITGRRNVKLENLMHLHNDIHRILNGYAERLDGEILINGMSFQSIHSTIHSHDPHETKNIEYAVFDIILNDKNASFEDRYSVLKQRFIDLHATKNKLPKYAKYRIGKIYLVKTFKVRSTDDITRYHHTFVNDGYEGIIIRQGKSKYQNRRVSSLLKWKFTNESDYEIIDLITPETGREKGALIWRCKTNTGKEFNVRPRGTISNRKKAYEYYKKNQNMWKGKLLQVYHEGTSDSGIPRNPRSRIDPKLINT